MKTLIKTFIVLAFIINANASYCQTFEGYFISKGVNSLCEAAHPSNNFLEGTYDIQKGYVDISIKSRDNVFGGSVHTDLRLIRGVGSLYFSDIIVLGDDDMVNPFDALKLEIKMVESMLNKIDNETYIKMRNSVKESFDTDFESWTGKMWALLAINLDYYKYMSTTN